jgi:hypothetical protein
VAGQVIFDLASAVQELVDNALDAQATTINSTYYSLIVVSYRRHRIDRLGEGKGTTYDGRLARVCVGFWYRLNRLAVTHPLFLLFCLSGVACSSLAPFVI